MRLYLSVCIFFLSLFAINGISLNAQTVQLLNPKNLIKGGEVQSCILPPGVKPNAPNGRIIISSDTYISKTVDFIGYYDLGTSSPQLKFSKIDLSVMSGDYRYGTNDHDIMCLPNGNIIFAVGCFSKKDVQNKPTWWNDTYRNDFGPGARSAVMFWRSTDGGESFQFYSIYDPLVNGPAYAANPQYRWVDKKLDKNKPWDMGGSDGQLTVSLYKEGNRIFLTFGIFGYDLKATKEGPLGNRIFQTLVLYSDDEGKTWKNTEQYYSNSQWRSPVATVKLANGEQRIYCNTWSGLYEGIKKGSLYVFNNSLLQPENFGADWSTLPVEDTDRLKLRVHANIWSNPLLGNCPRSNKLIVAWPLVLNNRRGLQIYLFDPETKKFSSIANIEPISKGSEYSQGSTIFHPVLVQHNPDAPVLIYWYNLDQSDFAYTVRGLIIYDEKNSSQEFDISKNKLFGNIKIWYGDYHTAGCFTRPKPIRAGAEQPSVGRTPTSETWITKFYPIWLDPDGSVQFAEVSVETQGTPSLNLPIQFATRKHRELWVNAATLDKIRTGTVPGVSEKYYRIEQKVAAPPKKQ